MPSPVGHGLAAIAMGWVVARPATAGRALWVQTALLAAVGAAPDLDLLIGRHSGETHSLGAAVVVATVAAAMRWPVATSRTRIWLAVALAWASHPLLDALAPDTSPPIGVMAFWPFSTAHVLTGWNLFLPIWRECCRTRIIQHNLFAMTCEVAILAPMAIAASRRRPAHREGREGREGNT